MDKDLKWIKKHYGEQMMHLCRELFYKLLDTEGLLPKLLENHFAKDKNLAKNILEEGKISDFKNFIFSFADVENKQEVKLAEKKTAEELMEMAGYVLMPECKSEEEIQVFKQFYAAGEEICTFNGNRLNTCRVWFALKKNFKDLKREDFPNPQRQDEYGTSVISIQFSKYNSSLSIKNRYNHSVNNPDNTFNSNLDNIIFGLTDAFQRDYQVRDNDVAKKNFELINYVSFNEKFYNYNYEINNIYYCDKNIILENGQEKILPSHQMLIDYYIFDFSKNTVFLYDKSFEQDCFIESLGEIQTMEFKDPNIVIKVKNGKDVVITINDKRQIIGITNENIVHCGDFFLNKNKSLTELNMPNLETCGKGFLYLNRQIENINLPNLVECDDDFICRNANIKTLCLPSLRKCGNFFLYKNTELEKLILPNLNKCGGYFLNKNNKVKTLNLPKLEECGRSFFQLNNVIEEIHLPMLKETEGYFLETNNALTNISLPNLIKCENGFLEDNKKITQVELPKLEVCGNSFFWKNNQIKKINLPKLSKCGDDFFYFNDSIIEADLPNLKTAGDYFMSKNKCLNKLNTPILHQHGTGFLQENSNIINKEIERE